MEHGGSDRNSEKPWGKRQIKHTLTQEKPCNFIIANEAAEPRGEAAEVAIRKLYLAENSQILRETVSFVFHIWV